ALQLRSRSLSGTGRAVFASRSSTSATISSSVSDCNPRWRAIRRIRQSTRSMFSAPHVVFHAATLASPPTERCSPLLTCFQVEGKFGNDELVEAYAFRFGFTGQCRVQRPGEAHMELAAVFPACRADRRFRQAVNQVIDLPAFLCPGKSRTVR